MKHDPTSGCASLSLWSYFSRIQSINRVLLGLVLFVAVPPAFGVLTESDILVVVNDNSTTSCYIGDLYRQYHPGITATQVVHLSGLADSTVSTANEIITRTDYNTKIAEPIRQHLVNNNLVNQIKCIVTTAGMPYRIEDSTYPDLIYPGGSNISYSPLNADAASVESELSVLFQIDSAAPYPFPTTNRIVNPYQGYRNSGIELFSRDILVNRQNFQEYAYAKKTATDSYPAFMEGVENDWANGTYNRDFSAGDIYLTARLDGPKNQGQTAIFAVHDMLDRANKASNPAYGISAAQAVTVFDDAPNATNYDRGRVYNLPYGSTYNTYSESTPQPPDDNTSTVVIRDDYIAGYYQMTGVNSTAGILNSGTMSAGHSLTVIEDRRPAHRTTQADLATGRAVVALAGFGRNGDEGSAATYLLTGGPGGGALFTTVFGAVFSSIESFNAVTLFSDVTTGGTAQGKIVDFLAIGGTGAIGHAFEPYSDAIVDNEFFFYNLLADANGDGYADMSYGEAAFTALPYLSWSEVVLGDPLMRIAYGPGGIAKPYRLLGDTNFDRVVTLADLSYIASRIGARFGTSSLYCDAADINRDLNITYYDFWLASSNYGVSDK